MARGVDLGNCGYRVKELQEMAQRCDPPIPTRKVEEPMIEGWDGAQKGRFQVLFETGWIDPEKKSKYRDKAPKEWLDEEGKIKEERKPFACAIAVLCTKTASLSKQMSLLPLTMRNRVATIIMKEIRVSLLLSKHAVGNTMQKWHFLP